MVNDIRFVQEQAIMNPDNLYNIKFYSKYESSGNKYQIWRGNLEMKKEVKLPGSIELTFNTSYPFGDYPHDYPHSSVRELSYNSSGEIATNTGTVNLKNNTNNVTVGVVVHKIRVRIGQENETD
jgi:hypothetical protein